MKRFVIIVITIVILLLVCGVMIYKIEHTIGNVLSSSIKLLAIELVGSDRQQLITDKQTIQNIADILNSIDLKPMSEDDKKMLAFSSLGGLRIIPDKNENKSVYVHGAGAIYISGLKKNQSDINQKVYYLSKDKVTELYKIINSYTHTEVLTETSKAIQKKYPSTTNVGPPIICDLINSYDGRQTIVLIKRGVKDGEPLFNLYILDEKYTIVAEFNGEIPKTSPYTAYTVYYKGQTITFGGLGKSKWNPYSDEVTYIDITNAKIEYGEDFEYSITPITKYGYIFVVGQRVTPAAITFYNDKGELQADQNDFGVGLGMIYDEASNDFRRIKD